jgi:hypothetical protein
MYLETDDSQLMKALKAQGSQTTGVGHKIGPRISSVNKEQLMAKFEEQLLAFKSILNSLGYDTGRGERRRDVTEMARNRVGQDRVAFEKLIVYKKGGDGGGGGGEGVPLEKGV